jgi:hypothetical protein
MTGSPPGGNSGDYIFTPSSNIRNAATSQCGAVGGLYQKVVGNVYRDFYGLGSGFQIQNLYFSSPQFPNYTSTDSPLAAIYYLYGVAYAQLDINYTTQSGLSSWTFRASYEGKSGRRWRNITSFYSQTTEDKKCVSDASLSCCGGPDFFHLPTPTTFSFSQDGVTVGFGGSSQLYYWTSGFVYTNQGYSNFLASDFDGMPNPAIQKYTACFANCDYSTNLCCNPLP